jgi:hypothetical protein
VVAQLSGGIAASASSGNTITLYTGHGFVVGNKLMVGIDEATFSGNYTVTSVAAGVLTLTVGAAITVNTGDRVINLGSDTGVSAPNYDASPTVIYSTPDTTTVIVDSTVTPDAGGEYGYWHDGTINLWELVLNAAGDPIEIIVGAYEYRTDSFFGDRWVNLYKTSGSGTSADPWIGWETAFSTIPTSGANILFNAGFYTQNSAIALPVNLTGWLRIKGNGGAIIKITSTTPGVFGVVAHSDYDTLKYIHIEGLQINGNSIAGNVSEASPILIGSYTTLARRLNYANIIIRDIVMTGISTTGKTQGIALSTSHPASGETATSCVDILIENIYQSGGNSGIVMTAGCDDATKGTTHTFERVTIKNAYFNRGAVPSAFAFGAGLQLGQDAIVKDSLVEGCYWQNSEDVGVEIDNPYGVTVRNCTALDCFSTGFYATNFNTGTDLSKNTVLFEGCKSSVVTATNSTNSNLKGFSAMGNGTFTTFGAATFRDCLYEGYDTTEHYALTAYRSPRDLTVDGFSAYLPNIVSGSGTRVIIALRADASNSVIRLSNISIRAAINVNHLSMAWLATSVDMEDGFLNVDGIYVDCTFTNNDHATGAGLRVLELASGLALGISAIAAQEMQGAIRGLALRKWSGNPTDQTVLYGVNVGTAFNSTVGMAVEACDFSLFPVGARFVYAQAGADRVGITFRDIATSTGNSDYQTVASAATLAIPASGTSIAVSGTTGITNISGFSWNGRVVTLRFTDAVSGLTVTDGGNLKLNGNLTTGTTGLTTLTIMYDGTNYLEVSRSVN